MIFQTCSRHPNAGRFLATCSGCAQELHDAQYGTPKPAQPLEVEPEPPAVAAYWDHAEDCEPCLDGDRCPRGAALWRALEAA